MNKFLYPRLAAINIKKNYKTYVPYILSCIGTIIMYYIMFALSKNSGLNHMSGGYQLKEILSLGSWVIAVFAVIFLFYTNSFLIKRRKKEFGLFNILGMEKKHISRIMFFETLYIAVISLVFGLLGGFILNRLMSLLLLKLIRFAVPLGFDISVPAITAAVTLFAIIFLLTFLNALRQIHFAKPVELLRGGQTGEKEPKTKKIITLIGVLTLGAGYWIALTTESPLAMIGLFFVAVILVIIGTYCLFTAGSIALLKLLRKSKGYYYKTKHFISISGMIYRMKQNAVGLANICILSTMVLVMISTTVSLYLGMEDVLRTRYPRNIIVTAKNVSEEQAEAMDGIISEEAASFKASMDDVLRFRYLYCLTIRENDTFTRYEYNDLAYPAGMSDLYFVPLADYNKMQGNLYTLKENEVLLYTAEGSYESDKIILGGLEFSIKGKVKEFGTADTESALFNAYYVIVPDTNTARDITLSLGQNSGEFGELSYFYGLDLDADKSTQIGLTDAINKHVKELGIDGYAEGAEKSRESFYSLYGGLFFLGIFLGLLFIMATVLIIYYKQISEGYDDKARFEIMQKVGMSRHEIRKSIHSQVLTVFFLPLLTAGIHINAAFKAITKVLAILNLTNIPLFAWCCAGSFLIFGLFYGIVYALTSRAYYKIVSSSD